MVRRTSRCTCSTQNEKKAAAEKPGSQEEKDDASMFELVESLDRIKTGNADEVRYTYENGTSRVTKKTNCSLAGGLSQDYILWKPR